VTHKKWKKGKKLVDTLWKQLVTAGVSDEGADVTSLLMDYKELEITRGFLVHLSMTFEMLTHHLKGFHLALARYLPRRNDEGWKLTDAEWMTYLMAKVANGQLMQLEVDQLLNTTPTHINTPPIFIQLTDHLRDDLFALREFFEVDQPQEVKARRQTVQLLLYSFPDASGGGLGSTVTVPGSGI
jgi:hypothetical protein